MFETHFKNFSSLNGEYQSLELTSSINNEKILQEKDLENFEESNQLLERQTFDDVDVSDSKKNELEELNSKPSQETDEIIESPITSVEMDRSISEIETDSLFHPLPLSPDEIHSPLEFDCVKEKSLSLLANSPKDEKAQMKEEEPCNHKTSQNEGLETSPSSEQKSDDQSPLGNKEMDRSLTEYEDENSSLVYEPSSLETCNTEDSLEAVVNHENALLPDVIDKSQLQGIIKKDAICSLSTLELSDLYSKSLYSSDDPIHEETLLQKEDSNNKTLDYQSFEATDGQSSFGDEEMNLSNELQDENSLEKEEINQKASKDESLETSPTSEQKSDNQIAFGDKEMDRSLTELEDENRPLHYLPSTPETEVCKSENAKETLKKFSNHEDVLMFSFKDETQFKSSTLDLNLKNCDEDEISLSKSSFETIDQSDLSISLKSNHCNNPVEIISSNLPDLENKVKNEVQDLQQNPISFQKREFHDQNVGISQECQETNNETELNMNSVRSDLFLNGDINEFDNLQPEFLQHLFKDKENQHLNRTSVNYLDTEETEPLANKSMEVVNISDSGSSDQVWFQNQ